MKKYLFVLLLFSAVLANAEPLRIVSLGPYVTENICLLGLEQDIIGLTTHDRAEIKKGREIIGTLLEPNIEKIVFLKPDIVIGSKEGNRAEHIYKLSNLGIKTLTLEQLYTFDDICKNFLLLAEALNCEEKAKTVLSDTKMRLNKTRKEAETRDKKKMLFLLGFKPLFTTGKETYINEAIQHSGGLNIFGDVNRKWFACSIEEVVRRNPDIIIFLNMEEEQNSLWEKLNQTNAVREKRIYSVESTIIASPTPLSFVETVENTYKILYLKQENSE